MLIGLAWFGCVFVLRIARTKLKFAFFVACQEAKKPLLWQSQSAPQALNDEYFVAYHTQAPCQHHGAPLPPEMPMVGETTVTILL